MKIALITDNNLKKRLLAILLLAISFFPLSIYAMDKSDADRFSNDEKVFLINMFYSVDFDKNFLIKIFSDHRLKKYPIVVKQNIYNKENRRNYEDFYSAYSFKIASRFSKKWKTVLHNADKHFEVDKEVLIAILLVETGLGNILGRYPVISVYSSILVEYQSRNAKYAPLKNLTPEQAYELGRLSEKAQWALVELKSLLTIAKLTEQSPYSFKGSFAGAFGIPQFLPSSYLKWGYDSDQNGSVNLFLMPDAIYSTANYLKAHGWKKGLYRESNKDVIYRYNHSDIYVETVLDIAKKIKASQDSHLKQISEQTRSDLNEKDTKKNSSS